MQGISNCHWSIGRSADRATPSPQPGAIPASSPCCPSDTSVSLSGTPAASGPSAGPGRSWYRAELAGEWLCGREFRGVDLREANLREADLTEADLRSADLRRANLAQANLSFADLRGADLRYTHLRRVNWQGAVYDGRTRWPHGFDPKIRPEMQASGEPETRCSGWKAGFWGVAGLILLVDQLTKSLVRDLVPVGSRAVSVLNDTLFLQRVENRGLTFQLLESQGVLLIGLGGALLLAILAVYAFQVRRRLSPDPATITGLALLFAGGLGNLLDRVFYGAVLDFIGLYAGPVFNLADVAVLAGAVCLGLARRMDPVCTQSAPLQGGRRDTRLGWE